MKPGWLIAAVAAAAAVVYWRQRMDTTLRVAAGIVIAGMAVYSTGVVELPDLAGILESIGSTLGPWTYLLVGVLAFLEAGAFVGMMVPGETSVVVGGVIAGQGQIDLIVLIAVAWSSAFLGDLAGYTLGRRLGRPFLLRHGGRFGIDERVISRVDDFFQKHGGKAIFIGRFIGFVRSLAPFIAGSSHMPLNRFIPYGILGSGLQSTLLCVVGYLFWHSLDQVLAFVERGAFALGAVIVAIAAIVIVTRWLRVEANRRRVIDWLEQRSDRAVGRFGLFLITHLRRPTLFLRDRLTPGEFGLEVTTLLALASVSSFVFIGYWMSLGPGEMTPGDIRGRDIAEAISLGFFDHVAAVVSWLGYLPVVATVTVAAGITLLVRRHVLEGLALLWGLGLIVIAMLVFKGAAWSGDPGQWSGQPGLIEREPVQPGGAKQSYPAAIAAYAVCWVAVAIAMRHAFASLAGIAAVLAIAIVATVTIALSPVYLREDWFSDAAGGLGLGTLAFSAAGLCAFAIDWFIHQWSRLSSPRIRR